MNKVKIIARVYVSDCNRMDALLREAKHHEEMAADFMDFAVTGGDRYREMNCQLYLDEMGTAIALRREAWEVLNFTRDFTFRRDLYASSIKRVYG